jgi:hypothetical protein
MHINLVLDPNFKTAYVESVWDVTAYDEGLTKLEPRCVGFLFCSAVALIVG